MRKKIMFGAGCFWGVQQVFDAVKGVLQTEVGYSGGEFENPCYEDVCHGSTGHAEVVLVEYDSDLVTIDDLLRVFWKSHNPTTMNRQGPDVGSQYRSAVFYFEDEQKEAAERMKVELDEAGKFSGKIVTEIKAAGPFYRAEEYHQKYFEKRGGGGCHI